MGKRRRRVVQGSLRRGVVGVRSFEDAVQDREVTRRENTVFGSVGVPPKRGAVSDVQKKAAELVRRVQGEAPPW